MRFRSLCVTLLPGVRVFESRHWIQGSVAAKYGTEPNKLYAQFERLTPVPFDRRLICIDLLNDAELDWLDRCMM